MPMKKFCALLCTVVMTFLLVLPVAAEGETSALPATGPELTAPAAYVVNLDTDRRAHV